MADQYLGEIRMFGGSFAPLGWAMCDGQLLSIAENDALYSLIGTTYGGDGQTTFAVPDLRGRVAMHQGNNQVIGTIGGSETVTLQVTQLPAHTHSAVAFQEPGTATSPQGNYWANQGTDSYATAGTVAMSPQAISGAGGNQPHENMMPFQAVTFIIATEGLWPSQS